jgi:hypothetical protein
MIFLHNEERDWYTSVFVFVSRMYYIKACIHPKRSKTKVLHQLTRI